MTPTTYFPFSHIPPEINKAAETLHLFFAKQGLREWQFSHVADRRLVAKLERELDEAKNNLARACSRCGSDQQCDDITHEDTNPQFFDKP